MTPEDKVMSARMQIRKQFEYFVEHLMYMQPTYDDTTSTMGVDMKGHLFVNKAWVEKLTKENVLAVVVHELIHIISMHPFRNPPEVVAAQKSGKLTPEVLRLHRLFNGACDLKVNHMFYELGLVEHLPECGVLPTRSGMYTLELEDGKHETIRDIPKKSAERLYRELLDISNRQKIKESSLPRFDDHGGWATCATAATQQQVAELAGDWMVRAAGLLSRSKGNLPEAMARDLEQLLEPVLDWRGRLDKFVQPIVATEVSYRRIRRSSWSISVIMPGRTGEGVHVVVHIDTSGSMHKKELEQILAEQYGLLDTYDHVRITLLHSDAGDPKVTELRETDRDSLLDIVKLDGGGGTSHKPVVQWVLDHQADDLRALICFTDGMSDIQNCFDKLEGVVSRMLVLTRESKLEELKDYCEAAAHLPVV